MVAQLSEVFYDRFFIELMRHGIADEPRKETANHMLRRWIEFIVNLQ